MTDESQAALDELMRSPTAAGRSSLAAAIHAQRAAVPAFESLLLRLAEDPHEDVQMEAATAMGVFRLPSFVPALLPMLASARRPRRRARRARLHRRAGPHSPSRRPWPISTFRTRSGATCRARSAASRPSRRARCSCAQLVAEEDGMVRYKILRGLGRLAAENPHLALDAERAPRRGRSGRWRPIFRLVHWRTVLARGAADDPRRATPGHELLVELLRDKEAHAVERVFRLLGLQYRGEDFEKIYRGLRSSERQGHGGQPRAAREPDPGPAARARPGAGGRRPGRAAARARGQRVPSPSRSPTTTCSRG